MTSGRRSATRALAWLIAATSACAVASGDTIELRDGTVIGGVVKQVDGGYEVTPPAGGKRFVASQDVRSIKMSNQGKVTEANARERLASLRRSIEAEKDLARVVERYEQFIQMNDGTEAARDAGRDLAEWRERAQRGMIRHGGKWVLPAERDAALLAAAGLTNQICALIAAGQLDAAGVMVRQGLESDEDNVSFHYLNGVLQLRRSDHAQAKRSFDRVAELAGDHPPTIVNQAVIAAYFKRWPQAITALDQAMTLAPESREILDNVAELTELVPDSVRRQAIFERMMRRFAPQEAALEQRMAQQSNLYRLGSRWVDKADLDNAKQQQAAFDKKKREMESDYARANDRVRQIDDEIRRIERMLAQMERDSVVPDENGRLVQRGYPAGYYDALRERDRLRLVQLDENRRLDDLRADAAELARSAPKPPFAGQLTPIGERGVPVMLPAGVTPPPPLPNTTPTTQASGDAQPTRSALAPPPLLIRPHDGSTPAAPPSTAPAAGR